MRSTRLAAVIVTCGLSLLLLSAGADAQVGAVKPKAKPNVVEATPKSAAAKPRPAGDKPRMTTIINVELLTGEEGVGLRAQQWGRILEKLDVTHSVRRASPKDKVGVTEKKSGDSIRRVQVVGRLDKSGRLVFEDRVYSEEEADKLGAWFDELRGYGALGSPAGQPVWGLTKQQFGDLHEVLRQPLLQDTQGREFAEALKLFAFPPEFPVRLSDAAVRVLQDKGRDAKVTQSLSGISRGTALAILLSEQGLSFKPQRLPDASIILSVEPLREPSDAWPVGWPPEHPLPSLAPKLYAQQPINLEDYELDAILDAAVTFVEMPILFDRTALAAKRVDVTKKVSHPAKRTTWGLALRTLLAQVNAKPEILVDESGRPFVWVVPMSAIRREAAPASKESGK